MKNKLNSLQVVRAFAACLVGMCHIWNDGILPGTVVELGGFGVDLFFVLSGFIMALTVKMDTGKNTSNAKYFLKKRIVRIFPIYLICAIPLILFVSKAEGVKNVFFYVGNILLLPSFTNDPTYRLALSPGWSLVYEMLFYYVFAFFLLFVNNKKKLLYSVIIFLVSLVVTVRLFGVHGPQLAWVNFSFIIGDTMLLDFVLGIVSYFIYQKFKNKVNFSITQSLFMLVVLCFITMVLIYLKYPRFISNGIISFLIIVIFLFTNNSTMESNWVKRIVFIGDASYSIYLIHFYFAFFKLKIIAYAGRFIHDRDILVNTVDIVLLISAIVAGCFFYIIIEKPIINFFSKRIKYKKTSSQINIG